MSFIVYGLKLNLLTGFSPNLMMLFMDITDYECDSSISLVCDHCECQRAGGTLASRGQLLSSIPSQDVEMLGKFHQTFFFTCIIPLI